MINLQIKNSKNINFVFGSSVITNSNSSNVVHLRKEEFFFQLTEIPLRDNINRTKI